MTIGIIGGGAAGMAAALEASRQPENQVILFERQARLGRKLQATGNGRCNLSNTNTDGAFYHGEDPSFSEIALSLFPPDKTLSWFRQMGLFTVSEPSGKVYPYSDQANSVVDVLRFALEKPNIRILTGFEVKAVRKTAEGFRVEGEESYACHRLIIACGGLAGTKLGGSMSGYRLLTRLGHHSTRLRPALVQLCARWSALASLKGVRANVRAKILHEGKLFAQSTGELQFTQLGLSGPVIFEISRDVCAAPGSWICALDCLPHISREELLQELLCRRERNVSTDELLTGILHNRLGRELTRHAGIAFGMEGGKLHTQDLEALSHLVKDLQIPLTEPLGMEYAQVTAGGIRTEEFDPATMESRLIPGLFACGEVLDVDGDCGGYNLQWAWSSGRLAGLCAGKEDL